MIPTVLLRYDHSWAKREDAQVVKVAWDGRAKNYEKARPQSSWAANPKGR